MSRSKIIACWLGYEFQHIYVLISIAFPAVVEKIYHFPKSVFSMIFKRLVKIKYVKDIWFQEHWPKIVNRASGGKQRNVVRQVRTPKTTSSYYMRQLHNPTAALTESTFISSTHSCSFANILKHLMNEFPTRSRAFHILIASQFLGDTISLLRIYNAIRIGFWSQVSFQT